MTDFKRKAEHVGAKMGRVVGDAPQGGNEAGAKSHNTPGRRS